MSVVIEVEGLHKVYRRRRQRTVAVDHLDLSVPRGGVFGFLGPNGSGKTTTIRCLLGLARASRGELRLLGEDVPTGLHKVMPRVGAVIESTAFLPNMAGGTALRLLASIDGINRRRVDQVLGEVGLADRAGDKVKKYSLGMMQRLSLAAALLKDPEVLVLDEPANGLDPAGIRQVRQLLRRLGDEGRTVFMSSHILGEVEQVCDRVAILSRGRCVAAGTVDEVLGDAGTGTLSVAIADEDRAVEILGAVGVHAEASAPGRLTVSSDDGAHVNEVLGTAGLWASEIRTDQRSLEDLFLELTEGLGAEAQDGGP